MRANKPGDATDGPRAPLVRVARASFGYDGRAILHDVELDVVKGAFIGVLGRNGSGKTTLFRGILGLVAPLEGTVRRLPGLSIGYVPQRETLDELYPISTREVVELGAVGRLRGLRTLSREDRDLALGCLERVGLADHARAPFSSLSGGQRQRVLLARALMARPDLLVLDEPTSGVDTEAAHVILDRLRELNESGVAVLLVSHDQALVCRIARRILWVADGVVEERSSQQLAASGVH